MAAISVQGLEKSFQDLHVLRGVDFDVEQGSIFALLGSNGAGKTTVVRILATLLKGDAGTATVEGFDVATQAGTLAELKRLLPPAEIEYVEKQPTLEDVFLAIVGTDTSTDTREAS